VAVCSALVSRRAAHLVLLMSREKIMEGFD
jgi:hypothetical protein